MCGGVRFGKHLCSIPKTEKKSTLLYVCVNKKIKILIHERRPTFKSLIYWKIQSSRNKGTDHLIAWQYDVNNLIIQFLWIYVLIEPIRNVEWWRQQFKDNQTKNMTIIIYTKLLDID